MEDIVDLGDTVHCPSAQVLGGDNCDYGAGFLDGQAPMSTSTAARRGGGRGRGRACTT